MLLQEETGVTGVGDVIIQPCLYFIKSAVMIAVIVKWNTTHAHTVHQHLNELMQNILLKENVPVKADRLCFGSASSMAGERGGGGAAVIKGHCE